MEKIERILSECGRVVLDLGAGHTHYEDPILFDRVYRLESFVSFA